MAPTENVITGQAPVRPLIVPFGLRGLHVELSAAAGDRHGDGDLFSIRHAERAARVYAAAGEVQLDRAGRYPSEREAAVAADGRGDVGAGHRNRHADVARLQPGWA